MPKEIMGTTVYSIKDVAQALGITERTVQNYIKNKRIFGQKIGGKWYFTEEVLKMFIQGDTGAAFPPNFR